MLIRAVNKAVNCIFLEKKEENYTGTQSFIYHSEGEGHPGEIERKEKKKLQDTTRRCYSTLKILQYCYRPVRYYD